MPSCPCAEEKSGADRDTQAARCPLGLSPVGDGYRRTMDTRRQVRVFASLEAADEAESRRRGSQDRSQRLREFGVLQDRMWGEGWTSEPLVKAVWWERVDRGSAS